MNAKKRILLIEDDPIMGESIMDRFELENMPADWAHSGAQARDFLAASAYDLVVSDIRLPDMGGDELFLEVNQTLSSTTPWLFITGYATFDQAVRLLKQGAVDYIAKPFDLGALIDKLGVHLHRDGIASTPDESLDLGISPALRRIESQLPNLAAKAHTLLITGESGVGKELVARAFHDLAPDGKDAPFVAVNCAALPESLMEAELFGYEKGAFTGAAKLRRGVFEQASGGTLFLDEIGDMPLAMQAKLLRVLQERRLTRIGGEKSIAVEVRLVSATHQDLKNLITLGRFREDLYYRINFIHLYLPPLRQRREDILWLAHRFLQAVAPEKQFSPLAEHTLLTHDWPGNVRELKHAVERGAIMGEGVVIEIDSLVGEPGDARHETDGETETKLSDFIAHAERGHIRRVLDLCGGHLGRTAQTLGISRKNLWEKMKKLGLSEPQRDNAS
jgi:DNA-binding NtrC family response regulator